MRFLIVSQYFYPENFRINDFAHELVRRGNSVTVLTGIPNYPKGKVFGEFKLFSVEDFEGIKIYRVPLIPRGNSSGSRLVLNYFSFLISSFFFGPLLLLGQKFDVVFSTNYSPATVGLIGIFLAKLKKAKSCLWVQDLWPQSLSATNAIKSTKILGIVGVMMQFIYKNNDLIFAQSRSFLSSIESSGINKKKLHYFPNWAEDVFDTQTTKETPVEIDNSNFTLMFAGNLGEAQSFETLLGAADILRNKPIRWLILGDGRKYQWLLDEIRKKKLDEKVKLLGSFPLETMPSFFSKADFLLVLLKKDPIFSITIPGKLQSYLSYGKPIISSLDGEGANVVVESGCGFNSPSEDIRSLAVNISNAMDLDEAEKDLMGANGKKYYNLHFNKSKLVSNFLHIISNE